MRLAPGFDYSITHVDRVITIVLVRLDNNKTKIFTIEGVDSTKGIIDHMESLTDTQCEGWIKK